MTAATSSQPLPILAGRYRIEEKLGNNRLATVYRAHDTRLQRSVLIHLLRKELAGQPQPLARFQADQAAGPRRSHRSLLEFFDTGALADRPYYVTEYVSGRALRDLGALAPEDALLYFRQVVGAVAACQAAGVTHPPVTSNNLLLVEDGHVELIESWLIPPAQAALDLACYRSPERTAGAPVSTATAVYALGLLLFELLTGRRVFDGRDPQKIAERHLTEEVPPLGAALPTLQSASLERLVARATSRDPADRPPNAASLGQELDELRRELSGETHELPPPPAPALRERLVWPSAQRQQPEPAAAREMVEIDLPSAAADQPDLPQRPSWRTQPLAMVALIAVLFVAVIAAASYGAGRIADRYVSPGTRLNGELTNPTALRAVPTALGITLPSSQDVKQAVAGTVEAGKQQVKDAVKETVKETVKEAVQAGGEEVKQQAQQTARGLIPALSDLKLPSLSDLGALLPEWLTGAVTGNGELLVVNAPQLNLRDAPAGNVVATLAGGAQVRAAGARQTVDGVEWLPVRSHVGDQDLAGWVAANYLKAAAGE